MKFVSRLVAAVLFTCVALGSLNPASAAKRAPDVVQIRDGLDIQIASNRAYVQFRYESNTSTMTVMLLRVPTDEEMAAYEAARKQAHSKAGKKARDLASFVFNYPEAANLYELNPKKSFRKDGKAFTVIAELPAGDYVVYGLGWNGYLQQCFCFGTAGFTAEPGKITDVGKFLVAKAWEPSGFPELKGEDNQGAIAQMDYGLFAAGIKPSSPEELPEHPKSQSVVQAKFRAIGAYRELNTLLMNRLAPIPGVLEYTNGNVVDPSTGKEVPPSF